jgi:hypothetical protein
MLMESMMSLKLEGAIDSPTLLLRASMATVDITRWLERILHNFVR